ncbi:hypothetical protein PRIPAC_92953 [Pristionchus pacificus]|uniref:Uncharacterized protein n=1 Tax=Pristionchus pacificus TaxID=54126 RepID=A0A2A6B9Y3_PRIPA|nr:hypothetical protein PRIPAC_92953 [Pristionchus pacificus]|eukprot:PDM62677.1 hypothetical protein PRIPAC_49892 [Pristionchus pacificus]
MSRNGFARGSGLESRPPLKFHSIHGQHIKREEGGSRVVRKGSFCNGIAFSNRPIAIDERVGIRQTTVTTKWSGVLRFGLTTVDPALHRSLELPKYACPTLSELPGYWIRALPDRYAKQGALVHFSVSRAGDLMYGIDGAAKGIFIGGIDIARPLWVIVDVYGTATAVAFESLMNTPREESIESQFESRVRVNSPSPPLSLPTRQQPPSRRGGLSIFGFSLLGGGGHERRAAPATAGRDRRDTQPPPPRVPAPETPVSRPRLLITSPPRQDRASAIFDWGISRNVDVVDGGRSNDVRPPVRTTSLVRPTPPHTTTMTSSRRDEGRQLMVPHPLLTSSAGRPPMETPSTTRVPPSSSTLRADEPDDIYRRIGQFSETTMRLARVWMESAVSPRRVVPTPMEIQSPSSSTARRSPPTAVSFPSSSTSVRRGGATTATPSDRYLRLQMTSSASRSQRAAAATAQNRTPPSTSSVRGPRVAVTAQVPSSSSLRRSDEAARRRSPLVAMSVQNKTSSATRDAVQKLSPLSSSARPRKDDDYASDCSICMEAGVNAVVYTCGHMCMCYECALKIKVQTGICPLCREPIKDVIRTYKS